MTIEPGDSAGKPNVILLVLDTLRYDYAMSDPFFSALSERGLFFERMYSPSTFTNASLSSVRSGMYPPRHGWRSWPFSRPFGDNIKTIGGFLGDAGYCVADDIIMPTKPFVTQEFITDDDLFQSKTSQEPFFLYSQYLGIHNGVFFKTPKTRDITEAHYQSLIPSAGNFIETAFAHVEKRSFNNDVLWVIMSDHGVGLEKDVLSGEGMDVGAGQIYDLRNRVYCVLIGPNIKPEIRHSAYSLIDLLPSILDYCDIPPTIPEGFLEMQGVSVFDEPDPDRYVYLEAQSPYSIWPSEQPNVFGATDGKLKFMETPDGNKCYDLIVDPEEKNDFLESMLNFIKEIK